MAPCLWGSGQCGRCCGLRAGDGNVAQPAPQLRGWCLQGVRPWEIRQSHNLKGLDAKLFNIQSLPSLQGLGIDHNSCLGAWQRGSSPFLSPSGRPASVRATFQPRPSKLDPCILFHTSPEVRLKFSKPLWAFLPQPQPPWDWPWYCSPPVLSKMPATSDVAPAPSPFTSPTRHPYPSTTRFCCGPDWTNSGAHILGFRLLPHTPRWGHPCFSQPPCSLTHKRRHRCTHATESSISCCGP